MEMDGCGTSTYSLFKAGVLVLQPFLITKFLKDLGPEYDMIQAFIHSFMAFCPSLLSMIIEEQ